MSCCFDFFFFPSLTGSSLFWETVFKFLGFIVVLLFQQLHREMLCAFIIKSLQPILFFFSQKPPEKQTLFHAFLSSEPWGELSVSAGDHICAFFWAVPLCDPVTPTSPQCPYLAFYYFPLHVKIFPMTRNSQWEVIFLPWQHFPSQRLELS